MKYYNGHIMLKKYITETGAYALSKGTLKGNPLGEFRKPISLIGQAGESVVYDYYVVNALPKFIPNESLAGRGKEIQKSLVMTGGKLGINYFIGGRMSSGRSIMIELASQGLALEGSKLISGFV